MNPNSLRSSSFVAYFSHLPPQEAINRCNQLQGAAEICSDVNNWKAYVAKRYGLKYSVQRPDLLTADDWMAQAIALEAANLNLPSQNQPKITPLQDNYIAVVFPESSPLLLNHSQYRVYLKEHEDVEQLISIALLVPGIPIIINDDTRLATFHVARLTVLGNMGQILPSMGPKHPSYSSVMFESAKLCHQWMLELLIPYYSAYAEVGYVPSQVHMATVNDNGVLENSVEYVDLIEHAMSILDGPILIRTRPFDFRLTMNANQDLVRNKRGVAPKITIRIEYVPAQLP
jgi:hypothetical protein